MNTILLNLLKKKFILDNRGVLDYIRKETSGIADSMDSGEEKDGLWAGLFFEVSVFNMYAGSYVLTVKLRDNHPLELQQFLGDFSQSAADNIKNGPPELSSRAHLLNARRFFYDRLTRRFLKPRPYVTQSLGFVMDMLMDEKIGFDDIKPMLQPTDRLMSLLFVRYLDNVGKILLMGRDNRFILS